MKLATLKFLRPAGNYWCETRTLRITGSMLQAHFLSFLLRGLCISTSTEPFEKHLSQHALYLKSIGIACAVYSIMTL